MRNIGFDTTYIEEQRQREKKVQSAQKINVVLAQWPWIVVAAMFFVLIQIFKNVMKTSAEMKVALPKFMVSAAQGRVRGVVTEEEAEKERQKVIGKGLELPPITKLEQEVNELAKENPDVIARIVRTWMGKA